MTRQKLPETVSTTALAGLLGLTVNRINALARAGALPKAERGSYPLGEAVRAYLAWNRLHQPGRPKATGDLASEKLRLVAAQADKAELAAQVTRHAYVPREEVERAWTGHIVALRARLLAVPSRVASALGMDRAAAARLDAELRAALEELGHDG